MFVDVQSLESIETWTVNRPDRRNALGPSIAEELLQNCRRVASNIAQGRGNSIAGVILRATRAGSANKPIWIAGGDLSELTLLQDACAARPYVDAMTEVVTSIANWPFPVIAVLNGSAIGGGAELALAADVRLGTQASAFEFRQLLMGLPLGYGTTGRLVELVGLAKAQEFLFLSRHLGASEALSLGLLHELFTEESQALSRASEIAKVLAGGGGEAFAAQKKMLNLHSAPRAVPGMEASLFAGTWKSPAHKLALETFHRARKQEVAGT